MNTIWKQKCVEHFPKSIPENAKNIQFNQEQNEWFGSEAIILKFNIDKEYINKELKKYNFKYKENTDSYISKKYNSHKPDAMMTDGNRIKTEGFTLYIIDDRESEKPRWIIRNH